MNSFRLKSNPTSTFAYSQLNKTQALLKKIFNDSLPVCASIAPPTIPPVQPWLPV